jgi:hypothetical protein
MYMLLSEAFVKCHVKPSCSVIDVGGRSQSRSLVRLRLKCLWHFLHALRSWLLLTVSSFFVVGAGLNSLVRGSTSVSIWPR